MLNFLHWTSKNTNRIVAVARLQWMLLLHLMLILILMMVMVCVILLYFYALLF